LEIFNKKIFLTTTLPYVNSAPHIGHSFEFILADAITRWLKSSGNSVHFNVGLDEHGLKVWSKANELGITPEAHIKNLTEVWIDFCTKFNISYDSFYKTSDKSHHDKVKVIWNRFYEKGDIYKGHYKGKYCVGCESHKQDSELVDGKCPDHPTTEIKEVEEENYFFKLSAHRDTLLKWLNENTEFLEPQNKLEELRNLIIGAEDISISRKVENCPWGVSVPGDDSQVIYVWFDALLNYIFAAGYLTDNFNWDNVIQLCGPDNLRFQAVIFQAFLESEGIRKTDKLLVHGTILDKDGRKMSKTLGNTVDPFDQLEKYGLDAVKYYTLAGLNTYSNACWSEDDLKLAWNNEINNDWGNLIARVLHLIDTKCDGSVSVSSSDEFNTQIEEFTTNVNTAWSKYKVKDALQKTNEFVKFANKYINDTKPWSSESYEIELSNLLAALKRINSLYLPVFPDKCKQVDEAIASGKKQILFNRL
jgi:methionyl-tRNA synthetase